MWKISGNFAIKKGQKLAKMRKMRQKHPFFYIFIKVGNWAGPPPPSVEKIHTFYFF